MFMTHFSAWERIEMWSERHEVLQRIIVLTSVPLIWLIAWTIFLPLGRSGYGLAMFVTGAVYVGGALYFIVSPNGADSWEALLRYFNPLGNAMRLKRMFEREPIETKFYGGRPTSYMTLWERIQYRWHYNLIPELTLVFGVFVFILALTALARFLLPFGDVRYGFWMFVAGGLMSGTAVYFRVSLQGQELLLSFRRSRFVQKMNPGVRRFLRLDPPPPDPWE